LAALYKEYVRLNVRATELPPGVAGEEPDQETKKRAIERWNALVPQDVYGAEAAGREAFNALSLSARTGETIEIGGVKVFYEGTPNSNPATLWLLGMMEFLAEHRYGRPLYQLVGEDRAGVKESSEKLLRITADAHKLRYGGPVKAPKGNVDHRIIFDLGMGRGLEKFTAEELVEFFDEFCPFCPGRHDPDALRRQRVNFEKQKRAAVEWIPTGLDSPDK
jgi:hypothetical protein